MNYELLDKLIPTRRLPDTCSEPRQKLHEMFRSLEELRDLRAASARAGQPTDDIDKQIRFYERILV